MLTQFVIEISRKTNWLSSVRTAASAVMSVDALRIINSWRVSTSTTLLAAANKDVRAGDIMWRVTGTYIEHLK